MSYFGRVLLEALEAPDNDEDRFSSGGTDYNLVTVRCGGEQVQVGDRWYRASKEVYVASEPEAEEELLDEAVPLLMAGVADGSLSGPFEFQWLRNGRRLTVDDIRDVEWRLKDIIRWRKDMEEYEAEREGENHG